MKKTVCIIILLSMTVHCASRLGIISFLYQKRHHIAYSIGIIAEIPIAICNGEYFEKNAPLVIHDNSADSERQLPVHLSTAKEITLFTQDGKLPFDSMITGLRLVHNTGIIEGDYVPPLLPIFHPPC